MTNKFHSYIEKLLEFVQPNDVPVQSWRDEQIVELTKAHTILGSVGFDRKINEWITNNQHTHKTFVDMSRDLKLNQYRFPKNFSTRSVIENQKLNPQKDQTVEKRYQPESVRIWSQIFSDHTKLKTSDLLLDQYFSDLIYQQFPEYNVPPLIYILKYLSWSFDIPLIIGTHDMRIGMYLMKDIHAKLFRLYENCVISPSQRDHDLCPEMYWEDFLVNHLTEQHEKLLRNEMYDIGHTKLGLFGIHAGDKVDDYHPKFRQLLRHYVYNEKCVILLDINTTVKSGHWLIPILRRSFTIELL